VCPIQVLTLQFLSACVYYLEDHRKHSSCLRGLRGDEEVNQKTSSGTIATVRQWCRSCQILNPCPSCTRLFLLILLRVSILKSESHNRIVTRRWPGPWPPALSWQSQRITDSAPIPLANPSFPYVPKFSIRLRVDSVCMCLRVSQYGSECKSLTACVCAYIWSSPNCDTCKQVSTSRRANKRTLGRHKVN